MRESRRRSSKDVCLHTRESRHTHTRTYRESLLVPSVVAVHHAHLRLQRRRDTAQRLRKKACVYVCVIVCPFQCVCLFVCLFEREEDTTQKSNGHTSQGKVASALAQHSTAQHSNGSVLHVPTLPPPHRYNATTRLNSLTTREVFSTSTRTSKASGCWLPPLPPPLPLDDDPPTKSTYSAPLPSPRDSRARTVPLGRKQHRAVSGC